MQKNQRPNQVNDSWNIPVVLTCRPDFGAPNCPVEALRYYHKYKTEHSELRKGRQLRKTMLGISSVQPLSLDGTAPL